MRLEGAKRTYSSDFLHEIFERNLIECSEEPAIIYGAEEPISYKQLNEESNRIAAALIDLIERENLKPNGDGDFVVAVCMCPSDKLVKTLLGVIKAGAAYLPIDPSFPQNRISHILQEAKPVCIVFDSEPKCNVHNFRSVQFDWLTDIDIEPHFKPCRRQDIAVVLYTSGSTGIPKGEQILVLVFSKSVRFMVTTLNASHFLRSSFIAFSDFESIEMAMGNISIFEHRTHWHIQNGINICRFAL